MRYLLLMLLALACRSPLSPQTPNLAGVWRLDGSVTDTSATCRFEAVTLYITQPLDSTGFYGQSQLGAYECTNGNVFPFPSFYLGGEVHADRTVLFQLVPYFSFAGHVDGSGTQLYGNVVFGTGTAQGTFTAHRVTP